MVAVTSRSSTGRLLSELSSAAESLRRGNWLGGSGGTGAGLGLLGSTADPLSALTAAGFGYLTQMISFLDEPLEQLTGSPGAVSSSSRNCRETGRSVSSLADDYRSAATGQTGGWAGDAADDYRRTGTDVADGLAALGQAATGVGTAISDAGQAVARTIQDVIELITEAVGRIVPIMTEARARGGTAIAEAIPRCVRIAVQYAQRIAQRIRVLLADGQNLMHSVQAVVRGVEAVKQALSHTNQQNPAGTRPGPGGSPAGTAPAATAPASAGLGSPAGQSFAPDLTGMTSPSGFAPAGVDAGGSAPLYQVPGDGDSPMTVTPQSFGGLTSPGSTGPFGSGARYPVPGGTGPAGVGGVGRLGGDSSSGSGSGGAKSGSSNGGDSGSEDGATEGAASAAGRRPGGTGSKSPGTMQTPGGARGGPSQEDKEHRSPAWLRGETGIFDSDERVAPAVIDRGPGVDDDLPPSPRRRRVPAPQPAEPKPVRMVWRLGEDGELVSVPKEQPKDRPQDARDSA